MRVDNLLDVQKKLNVAHGLLCALRNDLTQATLVQSIVKNAAGELSSALYEVNHEVNKRLKI